MNDSLNFKEDVSFGLGKGMNDGVKYTGHVSLKLFDENGNLKDTREIHNTVTNAGRYGLMDNILGSYWNWLHCQTKLDGTRYGYSGSYNSWSICIRFKNCL